MILILGAAYSFVFAQESSKIPVISFSQKEYDFGTVIEGDTAEYVFKFTNIGQDTLRIKGVRPG